HVQGCQGCSHDSAVVAALHRRLAADRPPPPSAELLGRVMSSAEPLLARNRHRAIWLLVARAVGAALLPLPMILLVDAYVLGEIHRLLSLVLPRTLSLYLVTGQATLIALLLAITYGAIPLLAERQQATSHT
ncbi:MAG: hypothetical protein ACREQY_11520, partial [Candidatus Binatia bacterium]